jgi:hypothetical protein
MAEITADILDQDPAPALSSTSDMPIAGEAEAPATPPAAVEGEASEQAEGEQPAAETPAAEGEDGETGEAGEETPAEQVAEGEKPPQKRPGINERFSKLTHDRDVAAAEAKAERSRAEAAERALQEALTRIPKADEPISPPPEPRPVRETFDTPEQYDEALIEWSTKRALDVARVEQAQHTRAQEEEAARTSAEQARTREISATQTAHADRVAAAKEKWSDYEEVAERDDLPITLPMATAIIESEDGPAAAYYLGQHPDVARRIAALVVPGQVFPAGHQFAGQPIPDIGRQLLEMGKVFAAVEQPAAPTSRPEPKPLPAPMTPVRRGGGAAVLRTLEELGDDNGPGAMDNYAARRMPELQAERRPGVFGGGTKPH